MSKNCSCLMCCSSCNKYYSYPKRFDDALEVGCKEKGFYQAIVECSCGELRIAGGENHSDGDLTGIMMFGYHYSEEKYPEQLDKFKALMLTPCYKNDPECCASTYHDFCGFDERIGRTIYLKPGEPKYIFRNLPVSCLNKDPNDIRWEISGTLGTMSGVLEWCTSFQDALLRLEVINKFSDNVHVNPDFSQFNNVAINLNDKVLVKTGESEFVIGVVKRITSTENKDYNYRIEPLYFYHSYEKPCEHYGKDWFVVKGSEVTFFNLNDPQ